MVVKKLKGFQTLTIEGQATSVLMNSEAKNPTYPIWRPGPRPRGGSTCAKLNLI